MIDSIKNPVTTQWRKAVKQAMRAATKEEARERFGTKKPAFNYRWEHVKAVVTLARKLARLTGADEEVVEAAAWLHDIRKDLKDKHPKAGAAFARQFLTQTDFPPEKIDTVARAIHDHMGLWRKKPLKRLESMVLWDADKLAKIGLTAVFHWTGMRLSEDNSTTTTELIKRGRSADWQAKTVASMHTEPARRAAQARLAAYNRVWDELEGELNGDDLGRADGSEAAGAA